MRTIILAILLTSAFSCGKNEIHLGQGGGNSGGGAGGGGADSGQPYASIDVEPATATVSVALGGTATQAYQVYGVNGANKTEITTTCQLSIDSAFGSLNAALLTIKPHGGTTPVKATCGSQSGTAQLTVTLTGTVVLGANTPPNAATLFGSATLAVDATHTPIIEYPIDQAVTPLNLPSLETQWAGSGDDLFHLAITSTHAQLDVYTSDPQATLSPADWSAVAQTAAGDKLTFVVEGMVTAAPTNKYASAAVSLGVSHDTISQSAIYWWAASQGSIVSQTFGATTAPSVVEANCTSCHSLSRQGTRLGYSRCVANDCGQGEWVGFLRWNAATQHWDEVINADQKQLQGSFTTFSPVGNPFPDDSKSIAIVTLAAGNLGLYDPDTGAAIASNIADVALHGTGAPSRSALMPDWSADGTMVAFASTPHPGQSIDLNDSAIATMSYQYDAGTHTFGEPNFLVQSPIALAGGTYNSFFFPSFSPDGQYVVFNAARDTWRNFTNAKAAGQRLMLTNKTGAWAIDLTQLNGGTGDSDITWAHWAPGQTSDYYWIVFSSERDYGHEVTSTHTNPSCVANGVGQCKQIWISAISRAALATGGTPPDVSAPPMWLPGQDTQADNISPFWTLPPGLQ